MNKKTAVLLLIVIVLILDQWLKIWVKTHMSLGDEFQILGLDWAYIHFVENPGMAFGLHFGGSLGKIMLTAFRLIVVVVFLYMMRNLLRKNGTPWSLILSFALIIAGAIGNIIDSVFYGMIFTESSYHGGIAEFVPIGQGYAPVLQGKVVDMFYFPLYKGELPEWLPFFGGNYFEFFRPVFNVADSAISCGIVLFLLNHRTVSNSEESKEEEIQTEQLPDDEDNTFLEEE